MAHKPELVSSFSSGRTQHASELDFREAGELIKYLSNYGTSRETPPPLKGDANNMRRKILSICHQMQWYERDATGNLVLKAGKPVLDFKRIDAFCIKSTPQHKALNLHTAAELPTLITIFKRLQSTTKQNA